MPFPIAGVLAAGGSLLGGLFGSSSAKKAAAAQERTAQRQLEFEQRVYDDTRALFQPFYNQGLEYNNALRYEILGGAAPVFGATSGNIESYTTQQQTGHTKFSEQDWSEALPVYSDVTNYRVGDKEFGTNLAAAQAYAESVATGGQKYVGWREKNPFNYEESEQYKNALAGGQKAIDGSAAARGRLFSGATLKAQQEFGTELAQQDFDNYYNRYMNQYYSYLNALSGGAAQGQFAAGGQATAGSNFAAGTSNALANLGNAQAAGYIGPANALTSGINSAYGAFGYMNNNNSLKASNGVQVPNALMQQVNGLF